MWYVFRLKVTASGNSIIHACMCDMYSVVGAHTMLFNALLSFVLGRGLDSKYNVL